MNKDEQDREKFLEEQLEWCKVQNAILEEIEIINSLIPHFFLVKYTMMLRMFN
ncbi:hypothetical protein R4Z09_25630 [Niallia oryzisoli]|uniref:Uncharacterized protein n=1 Tax=Niallia oryzisoli TaxID=1737571 RepID=A0ABZ2CF64_9BACI